jgi:dolichyldiphosphatase
VVLCTDDPTSLVSLGMAIISLSPILLMVRCHAIVTRTWDLALILGGQSAYAALVVQTREMLLVNMWAGQLACEGVSWLIKRVVKQDRPVGACRPLVRLVIRYADR